MNDTPAEDAKGKKRSAEDEIDFREAKRNTGPADLAVDTSNSLSKNQIQELLRSKYKPWPRMMPGNTVLSMGKQKAKQSQDITEPIQFARCPKEDTEMEDQFVELQEEDRAVDHLHDAEMEL